MTSLRNRTGVNDSWSIANALVGLFTFSMPKQTDRPSTAAGVPSRGTAGMEKLCDRDDVEMRHMLDGRAGGGSSTSPVDQPPASVSERSQVSPSEPLPGLNDESVINWAVNKVETRTPVNPLELYGLKTFLQKRQKSREGTIEPEVLDLTGSSTPSPGPSALPRNGPSFTTSSSLPSVTSGAKSRKMLQRNPNGVLHWRGAGSARSRSGAKPRIGRPVAGPSEHKEDRIKRRRLTEEKDDTAVISSLPSSKSAPVFGSSGTVAGPSTPANLSDIQKLSRASIRPVGVPSVPSPLRQVTNGTSSAESKTSSLGRNGTTGHSQQRTHAATVLTELIESVTPPPRISIDNPYQTEAPVKPDYKPKEVKRMTERREELARKAREKEQVKEKKDYSAKSIIEATVPKGAKRSRPSLPGSTTPIVNGNINGVVGDKEEPSTGKRYRATVEDAEEDEDVHLEEPQENSGSKLPPKKKARSAVDLVEDEDDEPTAKQLSAVGVEVRPQKGRSTSPAYVAPKVPSIFGVPKHSVKPKEPSKLRTSIVPEEDDTKSGPPYPSTLSSVPPAAAAIFAQRAAAAKAASAQPIQSSRSDITTLPSAPTPLSSSFTTTIKSEEKDSATEDKRDPDAAKDAALRKDKDSLPKYYFDISVEPFDLQYADAQKEALARKPSELPQFDFNKPLINGSVKATPKFIDLKSGSSSTSSSTAPVTVPAKEPVKSFDWAAAGLAPKSISAGGSWTCGTCMLSNPASATDKCTVCESPR